MRSDVLARHMKQHIKKNEVKPVTNISVTNNYNTISGVSTERKDEENENKDEELKKYLIKIENEYQEKLVQGKKIYKMLGEGIAPYQALPREMKEAVDLYMENQADFRADIFLFDIGKSMKKFDQINYDALEKMKDGEAFASKYDSQQLKIRVPNVVMVFSNSPPDVRELAKVRFRVFNINNNQLQKKNIVEIKDPKEKKENAESDSDVDSVLSDL